ncbi:HAD-IC family P-type ATPase [Candidatus Saccharibacteria bacterium]|nr:HAD-IC family P-type ATPase [Candidatus Saccharibacteria bacterium]
MIKGLSSAEVLEKIRLGETNKLQVKTISVGGIIRKHALTLFNIIIFSLSLLCILVGEYKNSLFIVVALANTIIAIVNDLRAKKTVEKIALIAEKRATVLRDGKELEIDNSEIVLGDVLKYQLGDQIIVDSKILDGVLEVNESFVTGESNTIRKEAGAKLISGSFVISGTCYARATAVGVNNFTNKILKSAKEIKPDTSELFSILNKIVKYISFVLPVVGVLLFWNQHSLPDSTLASAVTSTVSAIVAMIPAGLMLLTSSVLALATIRLSEKKVLVSDLYSIETLARVDTICLDKTGTLTTGNLKVEQLIPLGRTSEKSLVSSLRQILGNLSDNNATYNALLKKYGKDTDTKAEKITPFSSERKYSGAAFKKYELYMGAYEFLTKDKTYLAEEQSYADDFRVITVVKRTPEKETILGFILLSDEVRKNAKSLLNYFNQNGVAVKIISGDNLGTINKVCAQLNYDHQNSIDLSTLERKNWRQLIENYDIFARVKPAEKQELVRALEAAGHTVAMTGDGVNDVLALKEADCGISIGAGADAARKASRLVLLNNDFDSIPEIIKEGRRTINNITRSSTLFISKTIYASILATIFIFVNYSYPFTPIGMGLVNALCIGAPGLILALEPNFSRTHKNFWENLISNSVPSAIAMIIGVLALVFFADSFQLSSGEIFSFAILLAHLVGFLLIYKISRPLNPLRLSLLVGLIGILALAFALPLARDFFSLSLVGVEKIPPLLGLLGGATLIFIVVSRLIRVIISRYHLRAERQHS